PFLYFTSHVQPELARAVRDGRRKEFAGFPAFADPDALQTIPDPNDPDTWARSRPAQNDTSEETEWRRWYEQLLALRQQHVSSRLSGARSLGAQALAPQAVRAAWEMGDGARLMIFSNLGEQSVRCPDLAALAPDCVFFRGPGDKDRDLLAGQRSGQLPAQCTIAALERYAERDDG